MNSDPNVTALIYFALGYGLGSIPFGLVLTRLAGLGDIRKVGSGNIGATNVLRTGHKGLALATLVLDLAKGAAGALLGDFFLGPIGTIAGGLGAFLGHLFPIWLKFRGGKGVATYIGVLLAWHWPSAILFCAIWLVVAILTRYSSLSALAASLAAPIVFTVYDHLHLAALPALAMTVLLIARHRANISRLLAGTETKIGGTG